VRTLPENPGAPASTDTKTVIERHLEALLAGDVPELMRWFAPHAVVMSPDGSFVGTEAIEAGARRLVAGLFAPGDYTCDVLSLRVHGEVGLLTWRGVFRGSRIPFAVDTIVVREGRIVAKAFAMVVEAA
jgi:ketosteroid isomerase-like protein